MCAPALALWWMQEAEEPVPVTCISQSVVRGGQIVTVAAAGTIADVFAEYKAVSCEVIGPASSVFALLSAQLANRFCCNCSAP
ncbi:hypothetical protein [Celeribacter marinus]|uniref:hypothetical protein n=1 Tax=Celeribacter marinus TaxID=1397108 RepID=UPI003F6D6648